MLRAALLASAFVPALGLAALAATATGTFTVQLTIQGGCSVLTPATLNFGTLIALTTNTDQQSTFQVNCTNTTPYTVGLDAGVNGGTTAARLMKSGAATVSYALYQDSARTTLWGNGPSDVVSATGAGVAQTYTVYGRVPAQPTPAPGTYTDTITITVSY